MFYLQILTLFSLFLFTNSSTLDISNQWSIKAINEDCLEKAQSHDCSIFNRCCNYRCKQFTGHESKSHFCMAILGQIVTERTECACNSAVSLRTHISDRQGILAKFDLIAGIILIFIIDIVLLSFTL
uniref:Uncharacterized protein n=1 Tax=Panagrolaimus sp. PS1159 TaxID=55785 RepID=A0AC35GTA8_9BILA